jgi:hypothetical protein
VGDHVADRNGELPPKSSSPFGNVSAKVPEMAFASTKLTLTLPCEEYSTSRSFVFERSAGRREWRGACSLTDVRQLGPRLQWERAKRFAQKERSVDWAA